MTDNPRISGVKLVDYKTGDESYLDVSSICAGCKKWEDSRNRLLKKLSRTLDRLDDLVQERDALADELDELRLEQRANEERR